MRRALESRLRWVYELWLRAQEYVVVLIEGMASVEEAVV